MATPAPRVERTFASDAFQIYQLLRAKLLAKGHYPIDIELRLSAIVERAALPDPPKEAVVIHADTGSGSRLLFDFFGYLLTCEVYKKADRTVVRIARLED